jgi:hypothetical protein
VSLACPGSHGPRGGGGDDLDAKVEKQVKESFAALAKAQKRDGSWATNMGENQQAKVATAAFCGLALMTAGKKYQANVNAAASYVSVNLLQPGLLAKAQPALDQPNWKYAIGGLFLCEYYAFQKKLNPKFKSALYQKYFDRLAKLIFEQAEPSGGWGHNARVKNLLNYLELEVMSNWMLATAGALQKLGYKLPEDELARSIKFVEECCNEGKGDVGYSPNPGQKGFGCPCRTGGAIFAFAILGKQEHPLYPRMIESWKARVGDSAEGHGSISLGLLSSALAARQVGDEEWAKFKQTFFPKILERATLDGSFSPFEGTHPQTKGNADKMVGLAYNTGIFVLVLQLDRGQLRFLGVRQD